MDLVHSHIQRPTDCRGRRPLVPTRNEARGGNFKPRRTRVYSLSVEALNTVFLFSKSFFSVSELGFILKKSHVQRASYFQSITLIKRLLTTPHQSGPAGVFHCSLGKQPLSQYKTHKPPTPLPDVHSLFLLHHQKEDGPLLQ